MKKVTINQVKAFPLIRNFGGKIFSAEFIKANGEHRKMVCRTGVRKGVKGTGTSNTNRLHSSSITVFDIQKDAFRSIPLDRLIKLQCQGTEYIVKEG